MSPTTQGAIVLVVTLIVLLSGAPVAFGLGALSLAFLVLFQGVDSLRVAAAFRVPEERDGGHPLVDETGRRAAQHGPQPHRPCPLAERAQQRLRPNRQRQRRPARLLHLC